MLCFRSSWSRGYLNSNGMVLGSVLSRYSILGSAGKSGILKEKRLNEIKYYTHHEFKIIIYEILNGAKIARKFEILRNI